MSIAEGVLRSKVSDMNKSLLLLRERQSVKVAPAHATVVENLAGRGFFNLESCLGHSFKGRQIERGRGKEVGKVKGERQGRGRRRGEREGEDEGRVGRREREKEGEREG